MKQKYLSHYREIEAFITKDGSTIRELMHPSRHADQKQSLAEARLPQGRKTLLHKQTARKPIANSPPTIFPAAR